ncbi:MAG: GNAT family N-acetyltransferase [Candidatus Heimdallarchaeota archaeon]
MIDIRFERALEADIPELTSIMKRAFDDDSQRFLGKPEGGPPGYDDGSFLERWGFSEEGGDCYKIILDDSKAIGVFIVFLPRNGKNVLGTIFIDPEFQDRGIGTQAMQFIFSTFPGKTWRLDTPDWTTRNHHFYEKNGFIKIREEWDPHLKGEEGGAYMYFYEKNMGF